MLKIQIHALSPGNCDIEFKSNQLLIVFSANPAEENKGQVFFKTLTSDQTQRELIKRLEDIRKNPIPDVTITIADGMMISAQYSMNERQCSIQLSSISGNEQKRNFGLHLFQTCAQIFNDPKLSAYLHGFMKYCKN